MTLKKGNAMTCTVEQSSRIRQRLVWRFGDSVFRALDRLDPCTLNELLEQFPQRCKRINPKTGIPFATTDIEQEMYQDIVAAARTAWLKSLPSDGMGEIYHGLLSTPGFGIYVQVCDGVSFTALDLLEEWTALNDPDHCIVDETD